ncbi:hypothetical protein RIR_jg29022.t1 [Rhizophagus irregularis DAOM 181602=DAOM 197198]|nr:hypothetical protein RIR_jg29022.t1 [Rhizophagus irregularis DAOM 181602=DAOM 197198]
MWENVVLNCYKLVKMFQSLNILEVMDVCLVNINLTHIYIITWSVTEHRIRYATKYEYNVIFAIENLLEKKYQCPENLQLN